MINQAFDGRRFRRAVIAGADWVRARRRHLNEINVFPVPDGDTGTNMALSLSATAKALREEDGEDLAAASRTAADASVLGAKGNSGIILAHWFQGVAEHLREHAHADPPRLASAFAHATDTVYAAIEKPIEGTILTVMRATSDHAAKAARKHKSDVAAFLGEIVEGAHEALLKTPEMLQVLKDAHVVDAGAQGWVNFLQGMHRAAQGAPLPEFTEEEVHEVIEHRPVPLAQITNRYCTELVVRGKGFRSDVLRRRFSGLGDCLMVATTGELFKLHVHTNHPDRAMEIATKLGTLEERKVDDMFLQAEERGVEQIPPIVPLDRQPKTVAVVCDSTGDIPEALRHELGIELVPLQVMFGDAVFRDRVDLSSDEFYEMLENDPHFPTTSQPSPRAFVDAFDRVRQDRELVVCTVSSGLSGTTRSALQASRLAPHPRVVVHDSETASGGLGMMAIGAARMAEAGGTLDEIRTQLELWRADTGCLFTPSTLEYLRRGGRLGRAQGVLGTLLTLRPILGFMENKVQAMTKVRGDEKAALRIREILLERVPAGSRLRVSVVESTPNERATEFEGWVRKVFDIVDLWRCPITAVVGAHVGPGAWGVFWQRVRDDDPLLNL
jgi:fatty acid kinase/fatty acid kinase fatty acid binding subunit